jgi:hypothetical protein
MKLWRLPSRYYDDCQRKSAVRLLRPQNRPLFMASGPNERSSGWVISLLNTQATFDIMICGGLRTRRIVRRADTVPGEFVPTQQAI